MLFNYYYLTLLNHVPTTYLLSLLSFFNNEKIQIILWNILVTICCCLSLLPLYIYYNYCYYNWRVLPQLTSTYYLSSLLLQLHTFQYLLTTPPVLQCHSFAAGRSKYYFEGLTSLHPSVPLPNVTVLYFSLMVSYISICWILIQYLKLILIRFFFGNINW